MDEDSTIVLNDYVNKTDRGQTSQEPEPAQGHYSKVPSQESVNVISDLTETSETRFVLTEINETLTRDTRKKAIASIILSSLASLFCYPLFCTVPSIAFAISALKKNDIEPSEAKTHSFHSLILTGIAWASIGILIFVIIVAHSIFFSPF